MQHIKAKYIFCLAYSTLHSYLFHIYFPFLFIKYYSYLTISQIQLNSDFNSLQDVNISKINNHQ